MLLKKKYKRTPKPVNQFGLMFAQIGFCTQTYFSWANDDVFETINRAKNADIFFKLS